MRAERTECFDVCRASLMSSANHAEVSLSIGSNTLTFSRIQKIFGLFSLSLSLGVIKLTWH